MKYRFIAVASLLIFLLQSAIATGNTAPVTTDHGPRYEIVPVSSASTAVAREDLRLSFERDGSSWYRRHLSVHVEATYVLQSDREEHLTMAFPFWTPNSASPRNFSVTLDGEPLAVTPAQASVFLQSFALDVKSPPVGRVGGFVFEATIPQGTSVLKVRYDDQPNVSRSGDIIRTSYYYMLRPARYWRDFGDLNLTIEGPRDYLVSLNSPEQRTWHMFLSPTIAQHWGALPEADIDISLAPDDWLYFPAIAFLVLAPIAATFLLRLRNSR